jgi:NAD(P)H dehydrogenase (quinone)
VKILLILANPKAASFCHALAHSVRTALEARGDRVQLHDLCEEEFDPVLTEEELLDANRVPFVVRAHADAVLAADGIVIVHPNWWGQPPAILKGWLDRALRAGEAYRFDTDASGRGIVTGLLKARAALVLTTSNTPREAELSLYGDPLDNLWKRCVFDFCGIHHIERRNFESVVMSDADQRAHWLAEAQTLALKVFHPLSP